MRFRDDDLLRSLDQCGPSEFDGLPFGVVKMGLDGIIQDYNTFESKHAGLSRENVLGKNFFVEVAPCTHNYLVAQRLLDSDSLDAIIDYVFTWKMRPTPVHLRMLRAPGAPHMYLVIERRV